MQIITSLPSSTALRDALIREIKSGQELMRQRERVEEIKAERQAADLRQQGTVKGLGKCVAVIPRDDFFLLKARYGHDEVHSREFLRYYNKKFPHLSPHRA